MSEKMCECKTCKQQIASSAKVCPNCGAKNKKASPVLIGIVVFLILAIIIGTAAGNDEPVKVDGNTTQTGVVTGNSQDDKNIFNVGETVQLKDVQVLFIGVTESTGSAYNKPSEGNVFILCELEITNNSKEEIAVSSMLSFEAYCDDYTCSYSIGALLEKGNQNQLDGTVAAGKKLKGVVGYEVPANWQELELHFTPDFWSGKDIVFVATNN